MFGFLWVPYTPSRCESLLNENQFDPKIKSQIKIHMAINLYDPTWPTPAASPEEENSPKALLYDNCERICSYGQRSDFPCNGRGVEIDLTVQVGLIRPCSQYTILRSGPNGRRKSTVSPEGDDFVRWISFSGFLAELYLNHARSSSIGSPVIDWKS